MSLYVNKSSLCVTRSLCSNSKTISSKIWHLGNFFMILFLVFSTLTSYQSVSVQNCVHCQYKNANDERWHHQLILMAAQNPSSGINNFIVPLRSSFIAVNGLSPIVLLLENEWVNILVSFTGIINRLRFLPFIDNVVDGSETFNGR